jgi:hypothetical protein
MKKGALLLASALIVSISANAYLFCLVLEWQSAWVEQMVTTSKIERLYMKSGADVSFKSVQKLVSDELGSFEVVSVVESDNLWDGGDKKAISVHGTRLFFKDGQYIGSKANLPDGLSHWGFAQE